MALITYFLSIYYRFSLQFEYVRKQLLFYLYTPYLNGLCFLLSSNVLNEEENLWRGNKTQNPVTMEASYQNIYHFNNENING